VRLPTSQDDSPKCLLLLGVLYSMACGGQSRASPALPCMIHWPSCCTCCSLCRSGMRLASSVAAIANYILGSLDPCFQRCVCGCLFCRPTSNAWCWVMCSAYCVHGCAASAVQEACAAMQTHCSACPAGLRCTLHDCHAEAAACCVDTCCV
jgi:hypothetical protein